MKEKITLTALTALALSSCTPWLTEHFAKTTEGFIPFGPSIVRGISDVSNDLKDVTLGYHAPRKHELEGKKILFMGTLEEDGKIYQISDAISHPLSTFHRHGINRMNKAPEVRKQGILPMSGYSLTDSHTLSYYERIGGDCAIFKAREDSTEGEKYTLTFASSKAGTYTYENIVNGVLIGKGEGTFDVVDVEY